MPNIPSLLPALFDWAFWVPLVFRLFLAYQLYREAKRLMAHETSSLIQGTSAPTPPARKTLAWILMGLSFLFFFGIGVQVIGAVAGCAYFVRFIQLGKKTDAHAATRELFLLSAIVSFSLIFLGPGPYAVDLPL